MKNKMSKYIFCTIVFLLNVFFMSAQNDVQSKKERELTFVYVAHTTDVPLSDLIERLKETYRGGVQFFNEVIFYLSNGEEPLIVKVNTAEENKDDFETIIIDELWAKRSHDIEPYVDVPKLLNLINDNDFINEDGVLKYSSVTFDFYVSESFWSMNYNESIIAKLYFALEINKLKQKNLELMFNVYCPSDAQSILENKRPFGPKNLGNINNDVMVLPY